MSEQEARETACEIFGGNGDFYSFKKKPKPSNSTTIINESAKSIGLLNLKSIELLKKQMEEAFNFI